MSEAEFFIMEKAGQRLVVNLVAVEETKSQGWVIIRTADNADEDPWAKSTESPVDLGAEADAALAKAKKSAKA